MSKSPDEAAKAALLKYREPKYSESQIRLMLHSALLIKEGSVKSNGEIVDATIELHDLAIERGREAAKARND